MRIRITGLPDKKTWYDISDLGREFQVESIQEGCFGVVISKKENTFTEEEIQNSKENNLIPVSGVTTCGLIKFQYCEIMDNVFGPFKITN